MDSKRIKWSTLAFMAFSTVWGFGNVLNGFIYFNGIQVIFSWILMFDKYGKSITIGSNLIQSTPVATE